MLAALFLHRENEEARWASLCRRTARKLRSQLEWSERYQCHYWTQDMYGTRSNYLDAVHGFVATALPDARTHEARWLERARAFAMDGIAQMEQKNGGWAGSVIRSGPGIPASRSTSGIASAQSPHFLRSTCSCDPLNARSKAPAQVER